MNEYIPHQYYSVFMLCQSSQLSTHPSYSTNIINMREIPNQLIQQLPVIHINMPASLLLQAPISYNKQTDSVVMPSRLASQEIESL
jgi:hypothetical protein